MKTNRFAVFSYQNEYGIILIVCDGRAGSMIAIIDYDAGNIKSVEKALVHLGQDVLVTREREVIKKADKVILPGVGAFGDAMRNLRETGLHTVIREVVEKGTFFLGICLGL